MNKIYLCETPHPVIQGEGNFIGKKMLLLRVAGCDVLCKDCDSKQSWKKESDISYTVDELIKFLNWERMKRHFHFVMITGGAPALYQEFLFELFTRCPELDFQIEDAGNNSWYGFTHFENAYFSFSPKIGALQGSTNIEEWMAFYNLPKNWIAKIVVDTNQWENNYISIKEFQEKYVIPNERIYLMPFGTHVKEIQDQCQFLIDKCFEHHFNFSPRLHVLMFDNRKLV